MVVLNMSANAQKARFDLTPAGFATPKLTVLLSNAHAPMVAATDGFAMQPYSAFVAKVTQ